ncbi:MAG TPA: terminase TerL endonuclease subunit, partial [Solirubrobacteraceae bacterium]|nr:terminase TerL endonuclease subunit [Solirubrobacteraceae bacterium]
DYARAVVTGAVVAGPHVRHACKRHLADLVAGAARGLRWSPETAAYYVGISRFVRHSKAEWRGQVLELDDYQLFIVGLAFGWQAWDAERQVWRRRFRTIYIEIPKKNGKSTLCGFVGIIGLKFDGEPGAEIYAAATARKQALLVFNDAKEMVRTSPELREKITVLMGNLSDQESYSKFEPISADENTGDGVNPHFVIVDELHRIKTRGLRSALTQGFGARRQPMEWVITTAGDDRVGTPYDEEHDYAIKLLEGVLEDDSYFAYIACPDEDDPWDDPATWAKANPGYAEIKSLRLDLQSRALKARSSPAELADFKRFRLNLRTSDVQQAIKTATWKLNTQGPIDEARLEGRRCHTAIDLSSKSDITALVHLFPPGDDDPKWVILPRFWTPAATLAEREARDRAHYGRWRDGGWLRTCEGNRVDYHQLFEQLKDDATRFDIVDVAFDPWNAGTLAADCEAEGFTVVEFGQTMANYTTPTKEFLDMLPDAAFEHGAHPVLQWMASNLVVITDSKENKMPSKRRSTRRIDGITATIMALGRAIGGEDPASIYEERALLVIG